VCRQHPERAQHLHVDQPAGRVQQAAAEHHVAGDQVAVGRGERRGGRVAGQVVGQAGDDRTVIAEGGEVHRAYRRRVHGRGP